jgi:RimJ/RimL family protein N-acetyltransferase
MKSTREYVKATLMNPGVLFLGIKSKTLGRHVGNIKLGPIDLNHRVAEVGIMIGDRDSWGQGIAPESIALLARIATDELGLRKLTAGCYASNVGSARAFAKAGFVQEGRRTAHFILDDQPEDLLLMARFL